MLTLLIRKMKNTKWMVFCLLIGFIMASAMMSTIPLYMNASLQRMLVKDMESYQQETGTYPGTYAAKYNLPLDIGYEKQISVVNQMNDSITKNYESVDLPTLLEKKIITDEYIYATTSEEDSDSGRFYLTGMTDITDNVKITKGRNINKDRNDGVFEVLTTETSLNEAKFDLNTVYEVGNAFGGKEKTKIEVVGLIDVKSSNDPYWSEGLDDTYITTMFVNFDTMFDKILKTGAINIISMSNRYLIDYQNLEMTSLSSTIDALKEQQSAYASSSVTLDVPAIDILSDYSERSSQLELILWLVQIPVMLMILFYLFMVSQLNVESEKNEIAVFKSRGASRFQIMSIYALESLVLGTITAIIGPFIGLGLCKVLGASNGFLEFVNRTSLPLHMSISAFLYALLAVCVFFFTTLIPTYPATKTTIVEHKARKAGKRKIPIWEKVGLDFILILGSVGWLYYYNQTQASLLEQGVTSTTATVNPMLFVASTAFILGSGLLVIRLYPYIVRLIFVIGKRFWTPSQYVSVNNIGRSSGKERFIMIFLILTVSLGLFFANAARAINRNVEERIQYAVGCDAVVAEQWESSGSSSTASSNAEGASQANSQTDETTNDNTVTYIEPAFERFEKLDGVSLATRVYKNDAISITSDRTFNKEIVEEQRNMRRGEEGGTLSRTTTESTNTAGNVSLMTVEPSRFANVCWMKDSLLPLQINNYLEALNNTNYGVILSSSFKDNYGFRLGDEIEVALNDSEKFSSTVIAFVDYWPSLSPLAKNEDGSYKDFAIMNFDYVQIQSTTKPYEVWMKFKSDANVSDFYKSIDESHITPTKLDVTSQMIVSEKNDPMLQGMNGALTLGFIIIMIMCIIGFLIYWILSIKSRTLQFGILRAMGMKYREIISMIFYEQLLVSGVAVLIAVLIGGIASDLFVSLFQSLYSSADAVPPFSIVPLRSDYIKIYAIIGVTLLIGFVVLGRIIKKIKISQALKLGED